MDDGRTRLLLKTKSKWKQSNLKVGHMAFHMLGGKRARVIKGTDSEKKKWTKVREINMHSWLEEWSFAGQEASGRRGSRCCSQFSERLSAQSSPSVAGNCKGKSELS